MRRLSDIPRKFQRVLKMGPSTTVSPAALIVCFFVMTVCWTGVFMAQLQAAQAFDGAVVVAAVEFPSERVERSNSGTGYVPSKRLNESPFQSAEIMEGDPKAASDPGSKPPHCTSKCGKCLPCTPVRVPVQPGTRKTSEYYPEAWRCKCGGKLYMP